jgi:hypothetical protein
VFPVRYELSFYILIIRYSVFKGLSKSGKRRRNSYAVRETPKSLLVTLGNWQVAAHS